MWKTWIEYDYKRVLAMRMRVAILAFAAGVSGASAQTQYPFAGTWDCEVATFTFTDKTYNNGSETLRMTKVEKRGDAYELSFPKNYKVMVGGFKADTMSWMSGETGDAFTCKKREVGALRRLQSTTATALISTMQRGSVASCTICTVVVVGLASLKYSAQTRFNAS